MTNDQGRIAVHFGGMDDMGTALSKAYTDFMGELEDMENDLRVLETWQGAAGDVYREEKAKWDAAQQEVSATFAKFGPAVQNANEIFQEAERMNSQRWRV